MSEDDEAHPLPERVARIVGPEGRLLWLGPGESLSVGRHHSNDLVIEDPSVSRFHAYLSWRPGSPRPTLRDRGSHNGTQVNHEFIRAGLSQVATRTFLRLGDARLRVRLLERGPALIPDDTDSLVRPGDQGPELCGRLRPDYSLRHLLGAMESSLRTGTLRVETDRGPAELTVYEGRIMRVRSAEQEGPGALDQLIDLERGRFELRRSFTPSEGCLDLSLSTYLSRRATTTPPPEGSPPRA